MTQHSQFDVIVVGSGMSGGIAAKEFAERGFKVLVLDRGAMRAPGQYPGENLEPWDMEHRDRVNPQLAESDYPVQSQCYAFRESTRNNFINDRETPYQTAEGTTFNWIRGEQVGGKSHMWARQSYRWSEMDFAANKADGHGLDWPIRYEDVRPWYEQIERFVGISGSTENLPQLPDSIFQPAMGLTCVEQAVKEGIESTFPERNLIIGRAAHLTQPTEEQQSLGRGACQFRSECERGCSFGAYYSSTSGALPAAERTGNMTLVPDTLVERILYDPATNRATGVRTIDRNTRETKDFTARVIFLNASTIPTVQLLLNSANDDMPNGFGNSSGVLGHYIMDHHYHIGANGDMPGFEDEYFAGRRPNGVYIPRYVNLGNETDGDFVRGYGFQGGSSRSTWSRALGGSEFGEGLKQSLRQPGGWSMNLHAFGEHLPMRRNKVTLHATETDAFGIPQVMADVVYGENEAKMRRRMKADAVAMLEAAGATNITTFEEDPIPGFCIHEMGGARMGNDPAQSVLNAYNQSHDVPNVFATDGSAFNSVACQNPSLTFMALTARAVDYAATRMQEGTL